MANFKCPVCGGKMKSHGTTAAGSKRWQCRSCNMTTTHKIDNKAKRLKLFLRWLLSKKTQSEMGMSARGFRRNTSEFWDIWPMPSMCDEVHHVIHVDGIWLSRQVVILIACSRDFVVGWHLARSESAEAWVALMARIAAPDVVVSDGGSGFEKARRIVWPQTRVQRCVYHAYEQVKRCTTTKPKLQAGVEMYGIAKDLMHVVDLQGAAIWLAEFSNWCTRWESFLKEKTLIDGVRKFKHERLRKARRGLEKLAREGTLFTYLDEGLIEQGTIPATNNRIEGGINRQLRVVLNEHRGMVLTRRIKALFWWCLAHTECPPSAPEIFRDMPTDQSIATFYSNATQMQDRDQALTQWGDALVWHEMHSAGAYRMDY